MTTTEPSDEDRKLLEETQRVHAAVFKRLEENLWKDLEVIDEVSRDAAWLGTVTALIHAALWKRDFWHAMRTLQDGGETPTYDEEREEWLEFAGDCWDDYQDDDCE